MGVNVSAFLLPGNCLLCRQATHRHLDLCIACERELPLLEHACVTCAVPLPSVHTSTCGVCLKRPPPQLRARAVFRYAYPLDHLVQRFKFTSELAAGRLLGQLFAKHLAVEDDVTLLPVPLHIKRLRERGFNQAELLAQSLRQVHGWELLCNRLLRTHETEIQSNMTAAARRRNVRNAFSLTPGKLPPHVAIVDDVVTTGSTTSEIAALLKRHGVQKVEVWALARTPR